MEYNNLLELIKTVSQSNITGFHYEEGDMKITITTVESGLAGVQTCGGTATYAAVSEGETSVGGTKEVLNVGKVQDETIKLERSVGGEAQEVGRAMGNIIKSPLVGTFYVAPSEEADPFVKVGDHVKAGQTLAIVEAMKLMNDIESEFDGTVTRVFVKNGDCVEYGQPLFAIG